VAFIPKIRQQLQGSNKAYINAAVRALRSSVRSDFFERSATSIFDCLYVFSNFNDTLWLLIRRTSHRCNTETFIEILTINIKAKKYIYYLWKTRLYFQRKYWISAASGVPRVTRVRRDRSVWAPPPSPFVAA